MTPGMLLVEVESLRRKLGAETLLVVCTDRGTWVEMDAEVADVPEGVHVYSNIRGGTIPSSSGV